MEQNIALVFEKGCLYLLKQFLMFLCKIRSLLCSCKLDSHELLYGPVNS